MISNLTLGTGTNPFWTIIFRKVPKLRVTMLAVTYFCSDLRVKTPTSTNTWILSLRTKHLLVGWCTILWKRQQLGSFVRPTSLGRQNSGNLSLLPLWSKWKIVTTCSFLKEYTFDGNLNSWLPLVLLFCFDWAVLDCSTVKVSFPFNWESWAASRPLVLTPICS